MIVSVSGTHARVGLWFTVYSAVGGVGRGLQGVGLQGVNEKGLRLCCAAEHRCLRSSRKTAFRL